MASTLSLGQASYELLAPLTDATIAKRGSGSTTAFDIRSTTSDNTLYELDIRATEGTSLPGNINIFSNTSDLNANLSGGSDTLNMFGNADFATINTDGVNQSPGNDLINAMRDLTNSNVYSEDGNDSIRIAGKADNSNFFLGSGNDSLAINAASNNLLVELGSGNDVAQFRGQIFDSAINAGDGNDTVQFFNGFGGSFPNTSSVYMGEGNDSLLIGGGGSNITANTGIGNDTVALQGYFIDTAFNLGDGRNSLSLSSGSLFNTSIQSSSSVGDTLIFGPGTSIFNTSDSSGISLGTGNDYLVFGGSVQSLINVSDGADTVVFGARSTSYGTELQLGSDSSADKVYFNMTKNDLTTNFASMKITGAGSNDTLYLGVGSYTSYNYNSASNQWYNGSDTLKFA